MRPKSIHLVVVKVGSAVLAPTGTLEEEAVRRIADDLAEAVRSAGASGIAGVPGVRALRIVLVSSGAIASGFMALGLKAPPAQIVLKQAAAAVGQSRLMRAWADAFGAHGLNVAQVLLTGDDLDHRRRHLNARGTLQALLERGVVPIVNENDSVSFDEIKLGDNDRLSALVSGLVGADRLIMLSSAGGLADGGDPRRVIPVVEHVAEARRHVTGERSAVGTGGMATKLDAVETAAAAGVPTVVAPGREVRVVTRLLSGESIGTSFPVRVRRVEARKRWIGFAARSRGSISVDEGAARAIEQRGASLLPSGITGVDGDFAEGSVVDLRVQVSPSCEPFARGRVAYSADEIRAIAGKKAGQIGGVLGYVYRDEVIHRDDLVLLNNGRAGDDGVRAAKAGGAA
ncbi:MAG: glutamate 5-kinase [Phycisphaeraceae bacterium]|nr:glutamate 5-kinase [Phycisphaeraceae bacterium]